MFGPSSQDDNDCPKPPCVKQLGDTTRLKQESGDLAKGAKIIQSADSGDQNVASDMLQQAKAKQDTLAALRTLAARRQKPR